MTQEVLEKIKKVLTAYFNGEYVQFKAQDPNDPFISVWLPVTKFEQLVNLGKEPYNYRVKNVPKYVPFENAEEFIEALQKHGGSVKYSKLSPSYCFPIYVDDEKVVFRMYKLDSEISFKKLLDENWRFADNTICGKQVLNN